MAIKKIYQSNLSNGTVDEDIYLRKQTEDVKEINEVILGVIEDLRDTIWGYSFCIGLSAPQIGYPFAISVVNLTREDRANDLILINPSIISISGKKDKKRESCMSIWGKMGEVERRDKLTFEYRNSNFELNKMSCVGREARAIQHEIDHLNGILYSDRMNIESQLLHANFFDEYSIIE